MADALTFARITSLALADSVNPCAIAILVMILVSILTKDVRNRKKVLHTGLMFVLSVFIGYLFYGIIMVQFFKSFAELIRENSFLIYNSLAILSMIIGAFNIKDYFSYTPGGIATEMPLWMRPKVKLIINRITSPKGAFVIGFFITLFLLPCTIGPYIVASGLLAEKGIIGALPILIYYNIVFVLPMLAITLMIYFGFTKVEDVSGWKERNIRWLHLIAGILLFGVGISLLMGWL